MRNLPRGDTGDMMAHTDLIPGNVLVFNGNLAGVLDVGGLGPADPGLDLVAAWHLLDAGPWRALRQGLGCDDLELGARQGVGLPAGDGGGLVLPPQQPADEPDGPTHAGTRRRGRLVRLSHHARPAEQEMGWAHGRGFGSVGGMEVPSRSVTATARACRSSVAAAGPPSPAGDRNGSLARAHGRHCPPTVPFGHHVSKGPPP
jgi:hypothetical protein